MRDRLPVRIWWLPVGVALLLTMGCGTVGTVPREFVNSSADINGGVIHEATVTGVPLPELMLDLNNLAAKRGLVVVKKYDCTRHACKLIYKSTAQNKSINYSSTSTTTTGHYPYYEPMTDSYRPFPPSTTTRYTVQTANLSYFSKFFIALSADGSTINIQMVGVPVLNQEMSCPAVLLQPFIGCAPPVIQGEEGIPLAESFRRQWGYDVSGTVEAEVINGIFAELSMMVEAEAATTATSPEQTRSTPTLPQPVEAEGKPADAQ